MEVALQIEGREQRQILRVDLSNGGVLLGRGWNCAAILSDRRVDAQHAQLNLGANGEVQLLDLGSVNGTKLNGRALNGDPTTVPSGGVITLGRTRVTVFDPAHPVPDARRPSALDALRDTLSNPGAVLLLTVVSAAIIVGLNYLGFTGKFKSEQFVQQLLSVASVGLVWTLFWATVGKLVRGEAQLLPNWSLGMLAAALSAIVGELVLWLGFNLQSADLLAHLKALATFAQMFLVLLLALSINTSMGRRTRILLALLPPLVLFGVNHVMPRFDDEQPVNAPPALLLSYPPALTLGGTASAQEFLVDSAELFSAAAADAQRRKQAEEDREEARRGEAPPAAGEQNDSAAEPAPTGPTPTEPTPTEPTPTDPESTEPIAPPSNGALEDPS